MFAPLLALVLAPQLAPSPSIAPGDAGTLVEHAPRPAEFGWEARHPREGWRATFDGAGVRLALAGGASWGLELEAWGARGEPRRVVAPADASADGARVTYAWSDALCEWYVHDARGLEHGFTVTEPPPECPDGDLEFVLRVLGDLTGRATSDGRGVRFADDLGRATLDYLGLVAFDATGRDLAARLACDDGRVRITVEARAAVYPLTVDPLVQGSYLRASSPDPFDYFGDAVGVDGDLVVVGARFESGSDPLVGGDDQDDGTPNSGAAYVFDRSGGTWVQDAYLKSDLPGPGYWFGRSVAVSGETVVVGEPRSVNGGAAHVFVRSGGAWTHQQRLVGHAPDPGDHFGWSVAIDGDTIAVGARSEAGAVGGTAGFPTSDAAYGAGAVYVFTRAAGTWTLEAYLKADVPRPYAEFGTSVDLHGDLLVAGEPWRHRNEPLIGDQAQGISPHLMQLGNEGAAYVFERAGATWSRTASVLGTQRNEFLGSAVACWGDVVAIGAPDRDVGATISVGAVDVYRRTGGAWILETTLDNPVPVQVDKFGESVDLHDRSLAVGVPGRDVGVPSAGVCELYAYDGASWVGTDVATASVPDTADFLGSSVAISGFTVVAGAPREDGGAGGVDGDPSIDQLVDSGAAFVFEYYPPVTGSATPRNAGANPASLSGTAPTVGQTWDVLLDVGSTGHPLGWIAMYASPANLPLPAGQVLLVDALGGAELLGLGALSGPLANWTPFLPLSYSLLGAQASLQGLHFGGGQPFVLSNALDLVIGS